MASTNFQDYNQNTPIVSSWLNDVNGVTYTTLGTKKTATQSAAAWVRFSISGATVTLQQSSNVASVMRLGAGVYQINYGTPLTNTSNCYSISTNIAGFTEYSAEAAASVTITVTNTANAATDPGSVSVAVFGAN